jgi:hypothetical protein
MKVETMLQGPVNGKAPGVCGAFLTLAWSWVWLCRTSLAAMGGKGDEVEVFICTTILHGLTE